MSYLFVNQITLDVLFCWFLCAAREDINVVLPLFCSELFLR